MFRMLIEKSKALLPESSAFFELLGFAILASGIFSGLALITYDPTDSIKLFATDEPYQNMIGPAGAWLADFLLRTFGLVSFLIASILFFWGGMMALGFLRWPKTKRFVGFALIVVVSCGLVHIDEPNPTGTHLSNGFGGVIGTTLGNTLLNSVGYGGAVIGLIFAAVAGLVVTGNLTVSNTARFFEYLLFLLRRFISQPTGIPVIKGRRPIASLPTPQTNGENRKRAAQRISADQDKEGEVGMEVDLTSDVPKNAKPDTDIFHTSKANSSEKTDFRALVKQLESQLHEFKIEGKITNITVGPVVTTLEYEPTAGTKAAQIVSIANDIARLLRAQSVRVIPALPGKNTVGIEIPSEQRKVIRLGDVLKSTKYRSSEVILPVALGVDTFGEPVVEDLVQMPHL